MKEYITLYVSRKPVAFRRSTESPLESESDIITSTQEDPLAMESRLVANGWRVTLRSLGGLHGADIEPQEAFVRLERP